jgi:hypothetical protein
MVDLASRGKFALRCEQARELGHRLQIKSHYKPCNLFFFAGETPGALPDSLGLPSLKLRVLRGALEKAVLMDYCLAKYELRPGIFTCNVKQNRLDDCMRVTSSLCVVTSHVFIVISHV